MQYPKVPLAISGIEPHTIQKMCRNRFYIESESLQQKSKAIFELFKKQKKGTCCPIPPKSGLTVILPRVNTLLCACGITTDFKI